MRGWNHDAIETIKKPHVFALTSKIEQFSGITYWIPTENCVHPEGFFELLEQGTKVKILKSATYQVYVRWSGTATTLSLTRNQKTIATVWQGVEEVTSTGQLLEVVQLYPDDVLQVFIDGTFWSSMYNNRFTIMLI